MLLALQCYDIELTHKQGAEMVIADPLSRAYLTEGEPDEVIAEIEAINLVEHLSMSTKHLNDIKKATAQATEQVHPRRIIMEGWPEYHGDVPETM